MEGSQNNSKSAAGRDDSGDDENEFAALLENELDDLESRKTGDEEEETRGENGGKRLFERIENVETTSTSSRESFKEFSGEKKKRRLYQNSSHENLDSALSLGHISILPSELFTHILKFLSAEDLVSCGLSSRYLKQAAFEDALWRRHYCMRWGPPSTLERQKKHLARRSWKDLYFQQDGRDMREFLSSFSISPSLKPLYAQMQAAKRSVAPTREQLLDELLLVDIELMKRISAWRKRKGFLPFSSNPSHSLSHALAPPPSSPISPTISLAGARVGEERRETGVRGGQEGWVGERERERGEFSLLSSSELYEGHDCSGGRCTFHKIEEVYLCESTGKAHVCDPDSCREAFLDSESEMWICRISGRCFDRSLLAIGPDEVEGAGEDAEREREAREEGEAGLGSDRRFFGRAFLLGYNCHSEEELRDTQCELGGYHI